MTVTTKKAAIGLMREPSITSVWAYTSPDGGSLYAAFTDERFNDIYQSCNVCDPCALKEDSKITELGNTFIRGDELREERHTKCPT